MGTGTFVKGCLRVPTDINGLQRKGRLSTDRTRDDTRTVVPPRTTSRSKESTGKHLPDVLVSTRSSFKVFLKFGFTSQTSVVTGNVSMEGQ